MTDARTAPVTLPRLTPAEAALFAGSACIVSIDAAAEAAEAVSLPPDRVAWLEVPLSLFDAPDLSQWRLDVVLAHPREEAARLYAVARQRAGAPTRVSIHAREGVARAGQIALALHLPVRLVLETPDTAVVDELEALLDRYLHDSQASAPIEPFNGALACLLHGEGPSLWELQELDLQITPPPGSDDTNSQNDAIESHLKRLLDAGAECATCPQRRWCAGYFKHHDAAYDCSGVRRLFRRLETAAEQLMADVAEHDATAVPAVQAETEEPIA